MDEGVRYCVLIVDGDFTELNDPGTQSVVFDHLAWGDAVDLLEKSIFRGYAAIVFCEGGSEREE